MKNKIIKLTDNRMNETISFGSFSMIAYPPGLILLDLDFEFGDLVCSSHFS